MKELRFRNLKADEVSCRVSQTGQGWASLLLYKDARVDIRLLNEVVGPYYWKREHNRDNANCTVSIWDSEEKHWVSKEDVGVQSQFEAQKGLASSSFKRACTNWGIGLALYTAPKIFISANTHYLVDSEGKPSLKNRFVVSQIEYDEDNRISKLEIKNLALSKVVFSYPAETALLEKSKAVREKLVNANNENN